jgi:hypothetical protein
MADAAVLAATAASIFGPLALVYALAVRDFKRRARPGFSATAKPRTGIVNMAHSTPSMSPNAAADLSAALAPGCVLRASAASLAGDRVAKSGISPGCCGAS